MDLRGNHKLVLDADFMRMPFMEPIVRAHIEALGEGADDDTEIDDNSILIVDVEILDATHHFGAQVRIGGTLELVIPWRSIRAIVSPAAEIPPPGTFEKLMDEFKHQS